jgi:steroid delta-isomerase-like uncharacterized protein
MSQRENVEIVRRHIDELINGKNQDLIKEFYAEDVHFFDPFTPGGEGRGMEAITNFIVSTANAFPDFHFTVHKIFSEGDTVVWYGRADGTHEGDFPGLPASGRRIDIPMCQIYEFRNGRIQELRVFTDSLGLMQQVGALG